MTRLRAVSLLGLAAAAVLYVAGNLLLDLIARDARVDLTEEGLFTLSDGSRATLAGIDEPITLHLFYSERLGRELPYYATFARRVRELLGEIVTAADGRIVLKAHDPEPFSDAEDLAVAMGVQGIPLDQGGERAYFGLAGVNTVDELKTVAFFQPERENLLEYDLVELIHGLTDPAPAVLGVISSLPVLGDMATRLRGGVTAEWAIARQLTAGFDVVNLPQSFDELPANLDVLLLVHPLALGAREVYEIEQFLFRGGRAVVLVDPKSEAPSAMTAVGPREVSSSVRGLEPLLGHWGIHVPQGRLAGDRSLAWRVNAGSEQRVITADYVVWLAVTSEYMAQSDPVTADLPVVNVASAGYIERDPDSPLQLEPLIWTSTNSGPVPVERVAGLRPDIVALQNGFTPDPLTYTIAARLGGQVTTAFAHGPPARTLARTPAERARAPERAQRMRSERPVQLILVADTDLLQDRLWMRTQQFFGRSVSQPFAANATFVVNAIENLSGSDALITLRSRGVSRRPFERVDALRRQSEAALQEREQALEEKLKATQAKIASYEGVRSRPNPQTGELEVDVRLSPEQRAEVEALRQGMLATRAELRDVQRGLRQDVEALEARLEFLNIAAVPLLVAIVATLLAVLRMLRGRRRMLDG